MKATKIFDQGHQWLMFWRDPEKPESIIDTNQYMVVAGNRALLMDPGGIEVFAPMLGAILHHFLQEPHGPQFDTTNLPAAEQMHQHGNRDGQTAK